MRRDAGAAMDRCGPDQATAVCAAIRLEWSHHRSKGGTAPLHPAHASARNGAPWIPPRPWAVGACHSDGSPLTRQTVQSLIGRVSRRAGLSSVGVHVLRHTFCSHLAMRGAPARAIQELAGHADLSMTQRYMHLSPAAIENAIRLLDQPEGPLGVERIRRNCMCGLARRK